MLLGPEAESQDPRKKTISLAEKEYEQELRREKRMPGFAEKPEGGIKTVAAENRRKRSC